MLERQEISNENDDSDNIKEENITGDIKIVIAGYSRAAATTNLVAARIDEGALVETIYSTNSINTIKKSIIVSSRVSIRKKMSRWNLR